MWICVCGNANARIRWNEYTYSIMWKHVIDNVDMCVRWNGNTYLIMWIYVFDNVDMRVRWICPYAWRNVRCAFHGLFVGILRNVRHVIGNPLAAVGVRFIVPAYTYTPTKWQTEMRVRWCGNVYLIMWKHVIDNVEMCVRWNGNMYLMTWIHVFDNVEMCVRWCECTYLMTWIYIFDNVRIRARWIGPLRLTECSPITWRTFRLLPPPNHRLCWWLHLPYLL